MGLMGYRSDKRREGVMHVYNLLEFVSEHIAVFFLVEPATKI